MHNTINYTNLADKEKQALKDIKSWLTKKQREALIELVKTKPELTLEQFQFYMSFCGVSGYPVDVYFNHLKS